MSIEVKIPAVGESITSGVVSVWHKKSGDFVNAGDALFTLETDKVSTEIAAEKAGILETIVNEGQEVKIGEVVATIDDSKKAPTDSGPAKESPPSKAAAPPSDQAAKSEVLSPAVRRIVAEENIDPAKVSGSGKAGRLTKGDVLGATQARGSTVTEAAAPEKTVA
ncbi:MAG: dihydrolipoyllysine-residue succinyltransferase, partial [Spartobacteria bacterium]|nr:dihydrolipoyllysine-residue succinyltransferase [Spartobacteria bacterium]